MITNLDRVLTGMQIVHTWANTLKERNGMPPDMCADAEVYVKRGIDLIKQQAEEIRQLKEQEPLIPVWKDRKAYCRNCGKRIVLKVKPKYCYKCGRRIYLSEDNGAEDQIPH